MIVYHLGQTRYARQMSGEGARLFGGRWNEIGQPCIYTSEVRSLCILEYAANISINELVSELSITAFQIPDGCWQSFTTIQLPANWMDLNVPSSTQRWGTKQLQHHLALRLPSVIVPQEFNVLLNPQHPGFEKITIKDVEPFTFDQRIKQ